LTHRPDHGITPPESEAVRREYVMRAVALGLAFVVAGSLGAGQNDSASLNGYWKPESIQHDGKEQLPNAKERASFTLVVEKSEYRMYYMTDEKEGKALRLFVADFRPDSASRGFEMEVKDGQKKGLKVHGIYEVSNGTLKVCYGPADKPRPTKFEAPAGSGLFNEVWKYMTPQPKPAK
jgi:uncharacterized protein (TIGR03067 family)